MTDGDADGGFDGYDSDSDGFGDDSDCDGLDGYEEDSESDFECEYEREAEGLEIDFEGQEPQDRESFDHSDQFAFGYDLDYRLSIDPPLIESAGKASEDPDNPGMIEDWIDRMNEGQHKELGSWDESFEKLEESRSETLLEKVATDFLDGVKQRRKLKSEAEVIIQIKREMDKKRQGLRDELDRIGGEI